MSRLIDENDIIKMLNTMDRYTSEELTLCDTDKTFPMNEVFIVDDVFEGLDELPSAQPDSKETSSTHKALDTISRQAAISVIAKWMLEYGGEGEERERNALKQAAEEIKDLSSAQPDLEEAYICGETEAEARYHAEIVRCKDCKYYHDSDGCFFSTVDTEDDDYCSYAERRTDERTD